MEFNVSSMRPASLINRELLISLGLGVKTEFD